VAARGSPGLTQQLLTGTGDAGFTCQIALWLWFTVVFANGTVNLQHLESLADIVESITGVLVRERIPDRIIDDADEIELVDLSPPALRERLEQGLVYPPERASQALRQFFREGNLTALRELALRKLLTAVEADLQEYMREHDVERVWPAGDRVTVGVTDDPKAQQWLRRGWRMADRMQAELLAVFVETPAWHRATPEQRRRLEANLQFAEDLGARIVRISGDDVARELARIAPEENVARIVVGHSRKGRWHHLFRGSILHDLLRLTSDIDVLVVSEAER